jgi:hypothetical protein
VLLGNTPALTAEQRLYHLLLAGDSSTAAEEAAKYRKDQSFENYMDEVAIPALSIAAKDSNNGILRREQLADLKETTEEFVALCEDMHEIGSDKTIEIRRTKSTAVEGAMVVIPGRGSFDQAAGELFVLAARMAGDNTATCTSPGGLTGISAAAEQRKGPLRYVALITVGGVTQTQLELLRRRVQRDLAPDRVGVFVTNVKRSVQQNAADTPTTQVFSSLKSMLQDSAFLYKPPATTRSTSISTQPTPDTVTPTTG